MAFLILAGLALLAAVVVLTILFARRFLIARAGGAVEMSLRVTRTRPDRGWAVGIARFDGDQLRWYRIFSVWPAPRRVLTRQRVTVIRQRPPSTAEAVALVDGSTVVECDTEHGRLEIAMQPPAVTGFLSWLEAAAPGATPPRAF